MSQQSSKAQVCREIDWVRYLNGSDVPVYASSSRKIIRGMHAILHDAADPLCNKQFASILCSENKS